MLRDDWVVGFTEGEGTFTVHAHWNHTTRDGVSVRYKIDSPTFQVSQKLREVCDGFREFFGFGRVDYRANSDSWEYRVIGYKNCRKVALFFEGRLVLQKRREQFNSWCEQHNLLDDSRFDSQGRYLKGHSSVAEVETTKTSSQYYSNRLELRRWVREHPEEAERVAKKHGIEA